MPKRVLIAPQAEAQIRAIDAWWRRHRKRSPDLFSREFGEALSTLEVAPKAGRRYPHPAIKGLRRIPLRATRHHVYYLAGKDAVIVLAVWGSMKGAGPNLEGIEQTSSLAALLRKRRENLGYTQTQVADLIGSSQSRVAKMETGDPSVSVDLLIRTLLALGVNRKQVGRAIGAAASA